jgi:hypothetical protein
MCVKGEIDLKTFDTRRIVLNHEEGVFALDLWEDNGVFHVHCIQVDAMESAKSYNFSTDKKEAIESAIAFVVEHNKEN